MLDPSQIYVPVISKEIGTLTPNYYRYAIKSTKIRKNIGGVAGTTS